MLLSMCKNIYHNRPMFHQSSRTENLQRKTTNATSFMQASRLLQAFSLSVPVTDILWMDLNAERRDRSHGQKCFTLLHHDYDHDEHCNRHCSTRIKSTADPPNCKDCSGQYGTQGLPQSQYHAVYRHERCALSPTDCIMLGLADNYLQPDSNTRRDCVSSLRATMVALDSSHQIGSGVTSSSTFVIRNDTILVESGATLTRWTVFVELECIYPHTIYARRNI